MNNVKGSLLVTAAMLGFATADMFMKQLTATLHPGQVLVGLGLGSATIFLTIILATRTPLFAPRHWTPRLLLRSATEAISGTMFTLALSRIDLSTAAAIFQAMPLILTLLAALFLGETVGWRRWSALGIGFAGVLLIIRPGLDGFTADALLVLGAALGIAIRDILTRGIDQNVSSHVVAFQGFLGFFISGACLLIFSGSSLTPVAGTDIARYAGAAFFGAAAYWSIVTAMRVGEASAVAPFRFTRLVFAMALGVMILGERPDWATLAGSGLIVLAGLYTFLRERARARAATR
ncbi:EamA-like transporter family protein [Shimia sp. SK013]|uniref:DMT family transporter n=1 Tax=Shimia sp. SK013 TaxID=1389006 RepID=UPI0006B45D40|nr:DMT family transporter [Shimia sp. SK013]KPA22750.1 EamA-like transporter family protein [Shimia sp. SK013]